MSEEAKSFGIEYWILAAVISGTVLVYEGAVLMVLWGWFIVPLGVKMITLPWACGLCVFAALMFTQVRDKNIDMRTFGRILTRPAVVLAFGFAAKSFM